MILELILECVYYKFLNSQFTTATAFWGVINSLFRFENLKFWFSNVKHQRKGKANYNLMVGIWILDKSGSQMVYYSPRSKYQIISPVSDNFYCVLTVWTIKNWPITRLLRVGLNQPSSMQIPTIYYFHCTKDGN